MKCDWHGLEFSICVRNGRCASDVFVASGLDWKSLFNGPLLILSNEWVLTNTREAKEEELSLLINNLMDILYYSHSMSSAFTHNFTQNYSAKMSFPPCFYKHYAISSLEPTNRISKIITCGLKFLDSHSSQWQLLSCAHCNTFERPFTFHVFHGIKQGQPGPQS